MADVLETRYATPHLRQAAMQLLALGTAQAPVTSDHLAAASGLLLEKLSQELADVIGPDGVRSILRRAVKLMPPEFAFLDEGIVLGAEPAGLAEALRACLQEHEPELIREASARLFATFAGLLANVIGDRLMWSLLRHVWPELVVL